MKDIEYERSIISEKHILPYIVNHEEYRNVYKGSNTKIKCKCQQCNFEVYKIARHLKNRGFTCRYCSSKASYPERITSAFLRAANIRYDEQKTFKDLGNYKFDFFIPDFNMVIEVHGMQHYTTIEYLNSKQTQKNDNIKRHYCIKKRLIYIEIDAKSSNFDYIYNNLAKRLYYTCVPPSKNEVKKYLPEVNYIDKENIVKDYYNNIKMDDIAKKYNFNNRVSLRNYLKRIGVKSRNNIKQRSVVCLNDRLVFESHSQATIHSNTCSSGITAVCNKRQKSAGKHQITGEPLKWMYLEDYIKEYGDEDLTYYEEKISS